MSVKPDKKLIKQNIKYAEQQDRWIKSALDAQREELVRLRSHFDGFADILASGEPAGRKLDFLVQEINRETNTIGSKCQNAAIARLVVDIKCEIEKIREQIQNVE